MILAGVKAARNGRSVIIQIKGNTSEGPKVEIIEVEGPRSRNLVPEPKLTVEKEEALIELGKWWDGKIIAEGRQISKLECWEAMDFRVGLESRRCYSLVTHNATTEKAKKGILELGGVIYYPDSNQILLFGEDAGRQLRFSLGEKNIRQTTYGKPRDGKTFVYLHPIPYDLNEEADVYLDGPEGRVLAKAFNPNALDSDTAKSELEQVLQAPWMGMDTWLTETEGIAKMKEYLPQYEERLSDNPEFAKKLRMIDNQYLIAVV